jgi:nucleoside-diphosphate-sugar epimerase
VKVFVAGGSGTIGMPLVRALVRAGHQVTALTRSPDKQADLRALGATPAVADAFDLEALRAAVSDAQPTHVVHQLTALPKGGPRKASDVAATNRLRTEGTRNLLDAAIRAGVRRFIGGSFAPLAAAPAERLGPGNEAVDATRSMESQILDASRSGTIEGVVLRYGLFYGPGSPSTAAMVESIRRRRLPVVRGDQGLLPCIHIDDAVSATIAALDRAPAGSTYDIVDDRPVSMSDIVRTIAEFSGAPPPRTVPAWLPRIIAPYMARMTSLRLPLSNAKAKADLEWRPAYPTWRDGLAEMFNRAA